MISLGVLKTGLTYSVFEYPLHTGVLVFIYHYSIYTVQAEFFERWKLIGGSPREAQAIFGITLDDEGHLMLAQYRQIINGCNLAVLEGIDSNPVNLVAASVLHMSRHGKVGCLLRLEPNRESKVIHTSGIMDP